MKQIWGLLNEKLLNVDKFIPFTNVKLKCIIDIIVKWKYVEDNKRGKNLMQIHTETQNHDQGKKQLKSWIQLKLKLLWEKKTKSQSNPQGRRKYLKNTNLIKNLFKIYKQN